MKNGLGQGMMDIWRVGAWLWLGMVMGMVMVAMVCIAGTYFFTSVHSSDQSMVEAV